MEAAADFRDHYRIYEALPWSASLKDLLNTNLMPWVLVLLARFRLLKA